MANGVLAFGAIIAMSVGIISISIHKIEEGTQNCYTINYK